jgi:hypothetical protein
MEQTVGDADGAPVSVDRAIGLLQSRESVLRQNGLDQAMILLADAHCEEAAISLTGPLAGCLRDNNAKVRMSSLSALTLLYKGGKGPVAGFSTSVAAPLVDCCLGHSRSEVREEALKLLSVVGRPSVCGCTGVVRKLLDAGAAQHRNPRVKEAFFVFVKQAAELDPQCLRSHSTALHDLAALGVADASAEVRNAAREMLALLQGATLGETQLQPATLKRFGSAPVMSQKRGGGSGSGAHPFEALEAVEAVGTIYSERDLNKELDAIKLRLDHPSDWQGWTASLRRMAGIALGLGEGKVDSGLVGTFVSLVRSTLHEAVAVRICDLRSAVSREACRSVAVIAGSLREQFAPLAELWLPHLLKNTVCVKEVISASAVAAVQSFVHAGAPAGYARLLPPLLDGFRAKAPPFRFQCVRLVCMALAAWDPAVFEGNRMASIVDSIAAAMTDADGSTRSAARLAYFVLGLRFQASADCIMSRLDPSTQRHLLNDRSTELEANDLVMEMKSAPPAITLGGQPNSMHSRTQSSSSSSTSSSSPGSAVAARRAGPQRTMSQPIMQPPARNPTREPALLVAEPVNAPPRMMDLPQRINAASMTSPGHQRILSRDENHPPLPRTNTGGASRVARRGPPPVPTSAVGETPARRVVASAGSSSVDEESSAGAPSRRMFQQEVEALVDSAGQSHWSTRLQALEKLQAIISDAGDARSALEGRCGRKLSRRLVDAIDDGHHRCAVASLDLLGCFLACEGCTPLLAPHLGQALPKVFCRLTDSKEQVRVAAAPVLTAVRAAYDPSQLCAALCPRVLEPPSDRARSGMLEFITIITPYAAGYFKMGGHLRSYIVKLTGLLPPAGPEAAVEALVALHHLDPGSYSAAMSSLPSRASADAAAALATRGVRCLEPLREMPAAKLEASALQQPVPSSPTPAAQQDPEKLQPNEMLSGLGGRAGTLQKVAALMTLRRTAESAPDSFWKRYFSQVLGLLLDGASERNGSSGKEEVLRQKMLQGIRCLMVHRGSLFRDHTELAVARLVEIAAEAEQTVAPLVRAEARAALRDLCRVLDPVRHMSCLVQLAMGSPGAGSTRREALEALCALLPHIPSPRLLSALEGGLSRALEEAFSDQDDAAARQLAVRSFVEMYQVLGESLLPFMSAMPLQRRKLITIYLDKREKSSGISRAYALAH